MAVLVARFHLVSHPRFCAALHAPSTAPPPPHTSVCPPSSICTGCCARHDEAGLILDETTTRYHRFHFIARVRPDGGSHPSANLLPQLAAILELAEPARRSCRARLGGLPTSTVQAVGRGRVVEKTQRHETAETAETAETGNQELLLTAMRDVRRATAFQHLNPTSALSDATPLLYSPTPTDVLL